jgi:phage tail sheath protein FI
MRPVNPAFANFDAAESGGKLVLTSGLGGASSTVEVRSLGTDTLATDLKLTPPDGVGAPGKDSTLQGGAESPLAPDDYYRAIIGDRSKREGLYALEEVDIFNLLVLAGQTDTGLLTDALEYCVERRAFLIVDAPVDGTGTTAVRDMEVATAGTALPKSSYAAVYFPWFRIGDPLRKMALRTVAPSGTIAGLYARTDATRGVWKAPAGLDATLSGVQELLYKLTDRENGTLNPHGVNCLRLFPFIGPVAWGGRTLRGDDLLADEWKYIPVRRLALYLEESLYRGTKWAVFEPNDEPLWAQLRLNIGAFMHGLFRQGAFAGQTPRDAYLVKCDHETTTQDDVNRGVVNILIGFAPLKPAEFVILRFQQLAGQVRA